MLPDNNDSDEIQRRLDANAEAIKRLQAGLSAQGNFCPHHGIYLNWLEICPACAEAYQTSLDMRNSWNNYNSKGDFNFANPVSLHGPRHGRWPNLTPEDKEFLRQCGIKF